MQLFHKKLLFTQVSEKKQIHFLYLFAEYFPIGLFKIFFENNDISYCVRNWSIYPNIKSKFNEIFLIINENITLGLFQKFFSLLMIVWGKEKFLLIDFESNFSFLLWIFFPSEDNKKTKYERCLVANKIDSSHNLGMSRAQSRPSL